MTKNNITIRNETKDDYRNVENLTRESFWNVTRLYGTLCAALLSG